MATEPTVEQPAAASEQADAAAADGAQIGAAADVKHTQETAEKHAAGEATKPPHNPPPLNPAKKRKVALFLAYVGHGYQGMQRNPGARTIEDELFRALHAAGAISDANNDEHGFMKIHWMRAARTDKGVSAVGQVVSLGMVLEPPGMLERINAALPDQIRVFGFSRTTNGFDSRKHCDKRRYEYILPEWAFDPRVGQGRAQRLAAALALAEAVGSGAAEGGEAAAAVGEPPADGAAGGEPEGQPEGQQQQQEQGGQQEHAAQPAAAEAGAGSDAATAAEFGAVERRAGGAAGAPAAAGAAAGDGVSIQAAGQGEAAEQDAAQEAEATAAAAAAADGAADGGASTEEVAAASEAAAAPAQQPVDGPFVFDDAAAQRLTQILSHYEGTHNFHNYTVRKPASAPDAKRYILSFKCHGVIEIEGQRWVKMVVVGQSFMLHQIRKMVGMAVAVMRGTAPESCLRLALKTSADLNTPMAPELGLFLDECYFEAYNTQWGALHAPLRQSDYQQEVDAFKAQRLYPHIAARDAEEGVNAAWIKTLNEANYRFSRWEEEAAMVRQGGGRRPPPKGAGAASLVGSMESYGQHKRPHSGGARGGRGSNKRPRGGSFGGRAGRVLPPPGERAGRVPEGGESGGSSQALMAAGELSD